MDTGRSLAGVLGIEKDASAYGQVSDTTWRGLFGSVCFALFFQAATMVIFSFLRRTKYGAQWLCPKRAVCPDQTPPDLRTDTLFGWIPQLWNMSEEQILMYSGYDVVMFLKCLRLGFWTLAYFAPFALGGILPINLLSKPSDDNGSEAPAGYFMTTLANVGNDSPHALAPHVVAVCAAQLILMALTLNLQLEYIQLRRAFMKQRAKDTTVFVTNIPERMRSAVLLEKYFNTIYDGQVESVRFVKHCGDLDQLVEQREQTVFKLERAILRDRERAAAAVTVTSLNGEAGDGAAKADTGTMKEGRGGDEETGGPSTTTAETTATAAPVQESAATRKLRPRLATQNQEVGDLLDKYAEAHTQHEVGISVRMGRSAGGGASSLASAIPENDAASAATAGINAKTANMSPVKTFATSTVMVKSIPRGSVPSTSMREALTSVDEGDDGEFDKEGGLGGEIGKEHEIEYFTGDIVVDFNENSRSASLDSKESFGRERTASTWDEFGVESWAGIDTSIGEAIDTPPASPLPSPEFLDTKTPSPTDYIVDSPASSVASNEFPGSPSHLLPTNTSPSDAVVLASDSISGVGGSGEIRARTFSEASESSNPAILSSGHVPVSSRRQRLSLSPAMGRIVLQNSSDLWHHGGKKNSSDNLMRDTSNSSDTTTTISRNPSLGNDLRRRTSDLDDTSRRASSGLDGTTSGGDGGEWFPLTGSLMDLWREIRTDAKHDSSKKREASANKGAGANSDKAFLTFKTVAAATTAVQVLHSVPGHRQALVVDVAPDAILDMFWQNVHKSGNTTWVQQSLSSTISFLLIVFFVVPVTYLNQFFGPAKMEEHALANNWHWLSSSLGTALLPLTLTIIGNLLPPLFTGLGFFEGSLTWSLNSIRQLDRMVWFLLVNVFGVSLISGTIIDSIVAILKNPTKTAGIIARILPTMSGFFSQYVFFKGCIAMSIELLRGLTVFHMVSRWLIGAKDATKRERNQVIIGIRRFNNPGWLPFGKHFAHLLLVLAICLSFAPIAPLILVSGMVYFSSAQLVYRYTLCYVYEPRFEIGGAFWPHCLKWIIRIMYLSQAFMLCVFVLREYVPGMVTCFLLLFVTTKFRRYMIMKERELLRLPLEVAIYLDKVKAATSSSIRRGASTAVFLAHLGPVRSLPQYQQPSLVAPRVLEPEESEYLGKRGVWSTDMTHGGHCNQLLSLLRFIYRRLWLPFCALVSLCTQNVAACVGDSCDRSSDREELRDSHDGSNDNEDGDLGENGSGNGSVSGSGTNSYNDVSRAHAAEFSAELTPTRKLLENGAQLQKRRDERNSGVFNTGPVLEAL